MYTDSHGIRMMGDSVEVWTSCEAKMSRDFQSVGIQKGIRFTTPREDAEKAIEKATAIVRDAVRAEIDNFKEMIDGINDA
ncbi:MAG: hypothetical protein GF334_04200 [Candidatus Altiarchaeales archaeon]|nr:hypothetical protein [Candidatus Altiarchaeales archaeon]